MTTNSTAEASAPAQVSPIWGICQPTLQQAWYVALERNIWIPNIGLN